MRVKVTSEAVGLTIVGVHGCADQESVCQHYKYEADPRTAAGQ